MDIDMKKIITALLLFVMLFSDAFAFSSQTLSQLGMSVTGDESHLVLRTEFVSNVLVLLGISPSEDAKEVFLDVPPEHPSFGEVMAAYNAGIIHGEPGLTFRPDDPVTYREAIRVLVDILGYGGYVRTGMEYSDVAGMTGLLDGISYREKEYVTEENMSKLYLNAIDIPTPEISYENGSYVYNLEGETILKKHHDIIKGKGVLKSVGDYTIDENAATGEGLLLIENAVFSSNGKDFSKYLGMKVDYLYIDDKGDFTVVAMEPSKTVSVVDLKLYEIEKYSERKVYYIEETGKEEYIKLGEDVSVIYNGEPVKRFSEELFSGDNGTVRFISNENSVCDAVIITEYEDYFVDSVDTKNSIVYDRYNRNKLTNVPRSIDLSLLEEEDITVTNGKTVAVSDIVKGDVVSVLKNQDGTLKKAVVSQNSIEGKITSCDIEEKTVTVDGEVLRVSNNLLKNQRIKSGQTGKLYFNITGLVAGFGIESDGNGKIGYMRKVWLNEDTETCQIKMLTEDGVTKIFDISEKYTLDGKYAAHTIDTLKAALSDNIGLLPQVIRYTLNSEGKVRLIDTVKPGNGENPETSLSNIYEKTENVRYILGSAGFGNRLSVTADTLMFKVPDESTAKLRGTYPDDKYKIISVSGFKTDTRHTVAGYAIGEKSYSPDVIVEYSVTSSVDTTTGLSVISGISDGLNSNDEAVKIITYISEGTETETATESPEVTSGITLNVGDAVRFSLTDDGEINYIEKLYSVSDGYDDTTAFGNGVANSAIDTHAASMFTKAHVYDKENSLLFVAKLKDIKEKGNKGLSLSDMAAYDTSSASIVIYDKDERFKVRDGGLWDLRTTSSSLNPGDMVILHVRYSKLMTVYVVR